MKDVKNVIKIVLLVVILITIVSMATGVYAITPSDVTGNSDVNIQGVENIGNSIVKVITTIGIFASVIVLVVLGVKYMMGSAEEKAEYKKTLLPYVVGAVLVFAASAIATVVYNFVGNMAGV